MPDLVMTEQKPGESRVFAAEGVKAVKGRRMS